VAAARAKMALRQAVMAGSVDVLFVRDLHRLSRSAVVLCFLLAWFLAHNVAIAMMSSAHAPGATPAAVPER
jgi:DNA invertase Pin-like site-specific DNA recombinase